MIYIFFLLVNFLTMGLGVFLAIRQKEQRLLHAENVKNSDTKEENATQSAESAEQIKLQDSQESVSSASETGLHTETWQSQPKESHGSFHEQETFTGHENAFSAETFTPTNEENFHQPENTAESDLNENKSDFDEAKSDETESNETENEDETESDETAPQSSFSELQQSETESSFEQNFSGHSDELETSMIEPLPSTAVIENIVNMIQENNGVISENDGLNEFSEIASQLQEIHDLIASPDKKYYISQDAESFITPAEFPFVTSMFCRPIVGRKK